jgi:mevalonate kinase
MKEMIPVQIQSLWEEGINTEKFSLKLCGAGGGGFMLAFCYDGNNPEINFGEFISYKVITL